MANAGKFLAVILAIGFLLGRGGVSMADEETTGKARNWVREHERRMRPLEIQSNLAWWQANNSGKEEDFQKKEEAQNKIDAELSQKARFEQVKALHGKLGQIDDSHVRRSVQVLYLAYLEKQVDPAILKEMVSLGNRVEKGFNEYRAKIDGKEMTDNEIRGILKNSTDSSRRKAAWEASKGVGALVESDLRRLASLRNQAAKSLGFANFHAMTLHLNEQDGGDLLKLFDELDELTRGPFLAAKAEIDAALSKQCGVPVPDLMPWHYHDPFFQESPAVLPADLDKPWKSADILKVCRDFYRGIGLPIERVLEKSDLYEKKGKSPHAFCTDIDREGDVRVLANIVPGDYWASTMLHELGHSVYSSLNIPAELPYTLRGEAHILTTEGTAMMFERLSKRKEFFKSMAISLEDENAFGKSAAKALRWRLLIFSRWCQVMLRFEKGMYENPDQDMNQLWWSLVEKYQGIKKPAGRSAPDYASKIHIVSAPVYYHNYMMGELFASQVHHAICKEIYPGQSPDVVDYAGNPKVGQFMKEKVFAPGRVYRWDDLIKKATGQPLSAKAFALDFSEK